MARKRPFNALTESDRSRLARDLFTVLEYDSDGNPGSEWSSDTLEDISNVFASYGVTFTDPNGA